MAAVDWAKPRWTEASFLLYAGGLTVLGSAVGSLVYLSRSYSDGGLVLWTLLILVILYAIAHGFRIRDRWIAAGVFAFASVIAWAAFVYALWAWFGWLHSTSFAHPFEGFSLARLSFVLLVLAASIDDRRRFRFPFISAITVVAVWYLVTDLISGGGNWTTWVTLLVGLIFLAAGGAMDSPSSFWWNLGAGVLIGAALLDWWHVDDLDYALVSVVCAALRRDRLRDAALELGGAGDDRPLPRGLSLREGVVERDCVGHRSHERPRLGAVRGVRVRRIPARRPRFEEARRRRGRARAPRRSGYAPIRLTP